MYQPIHIPQLKRIPLDLSCVQFDVFYSNRFTHPDEDGHDPLHCHSYLEIFFNVSSDVSFLVNNRLYPVQPGDAIVSRANDVHVCIYNKAYAHEYFCLWIDANQNSPIFSFLNHKDFSPLFSFEKKTKETLFNLLQTLLKLSQKGEDELKKTTCLLQILSFFEKTPNNDSVPIPIPQEFQKILDYIDQNFVELRSVNDVVKSQFVSSATLNRWFNKYIHSSPHKYLEFKKLSFAANLLTQNATVMQACMQSGFSDCSHFISSFKNKFGETPFQYKKRRRSSIFVETS